MKSLYIGLMSGTSLDGVDAVLLNIENDHSMQVIGEHAEEYPAGLKADILALQNICLNELERAEICAQSLSHLYARVVQNLLTKYNIAPKEVQAIACHGQTIRHAPHNGYTLQIGNLSLLAELCGIDVIGQFRQADIAAGGQGAPLVPAFHQHVFAHPEQNRVILNIGGIANLTRLQAKEPIIGFDTGPGNMLMDAWIYKHKGVYFDENGQWASSGTVHLPLLLNLLRDPYFALPAPKSTGRDTFNLDWLQAHLNAFEVIAPNDVQATLLDLSAQSISHSIHKYASETHSVFMCGGGVKNTSLIQRLKALNPEILFLSTDDLGMPAQLVEAAAFAWLGYRFCHRLSANCPDVTGAKAPRILGALYPHSI